MITGMECFAVRSGDLWKRGSVIQVIASSTGKETDEVSLPLLFILLASYRHNVCYVVFSYSDQEP